MLLQFSIRATPMTENWDAGRETASASDKLDCQACKNVEFKGANGHSAGILGKQGRKGPHPVQPPAQGRVTPD